MSLFPLLMKFADDSIMGDFDYIRLCPEVTPRPDLKSFLDKYNLAISSLEKDGLQLSMNVKDFEPRELSLVSTADNSIDVERKCDENKDERDKIKRHFVREYTLPTRQIDLKQVISSMANSNPIETQITMVPIQQTEENDETEGKLIRRDERLVPIELGN